MLMTGRQKAKAGELVNEGRGHAEAFFIAKARAAAERRSLYLMLATGDIFVKRPKEGPWLMVSPNGETEASGVGRKRVRRKKPGRAELVSLGAEEA